VRGVRDVERRLQVHERPGSLSMLQGDKPKPTGQPLDVLQRHWSPATRFLIGAGGAFLLYSVGRYAKSAALVPGSLFAAMTAYRLADGAATPRSEPRHSWTGRAKPKHEVIGGWSN